MSGHEHLDAGDPLVARALALADEFLAAGRSEIGELAEGDIERLHAAALALRSAATGPATASRRAEHVAYLLVAAAAQQVLAARDRQ